MADIINSYNNTEELLKAFPVINSTPVTTEMEKKIQNRLLTGFENWNRGTEAWMEWGDILYTQDSLYNVHGVHLTLKEYQTTSSLSFKSQAMMMGDFHNMLICGDWCAIRYDITSTDRRTGTTRPGSVMEFVKFKDYGPELGCRVVEGWAGTKGADYAGLMHFLNPEETAAQNAFMDRVAAMNLPETDDLAAKYPVNYPTPDNSEWADEIRTAILNEFEVWNRGAENYAAFAENFYAADYVAHSDRAELSLPEYLAATLEKEKTSKTTRLYFESMLISGEWAAIHYRVKKTDPATGESTADNEMKFLHFAKKDDGLRVIESWVK